MFFSLSNSKN